ncbi:MAG: NAD-dependent protein deacetylase [Muribaculaceae bacterium]|nr:NAD-dependent protein deacetylase [Muribaculaceae bacterium]
MTEKNKIEILREKINEADAIVVGGASGMSAASGFRWYYEDDDDYKEIAGGLREKYKDYNSFDLFYDRRLTRGELWALNLRSIKKIYEAPTGETYTDLADLLRGKNYYIVTTNQDAQFFRVFPEDRITRLQGDWRYFQVKSGLYDKLYYNKELVYKLLPEIKNDSLPEHLIPHSVDTGEELDGWVRSPRFLQGKDYEREFERYMNFLRANMNKKVLFLELGVGMMTPMFIKEPFMNMTYQWPKAFYATINPKHAIIPKEIARKSLAIEDNIAFVLKELLGKDTSHLKREKGKDIFDSSKIY